MQSKPRHKMPRRGVFRPLLTFLAVIVGLVLVGPISPANADSGTCDTSGGYNKIDSSSGSFSDDWGSMDWSGSTLSYTVNDGYTVKFCTKAGSDVSCDSGDVTESGPIVGYQEGELLTCVGGNGQNRQISHVGWALVETPPPPTPEDASAAVDITPATCDTGETATPGDIANASWDSTEPTEGPGSYSYTATADADHAFAGGDPSMEFTGDLAGPLTGEDCVEPPEVEGEQGHGHHHGTKHDPEVKGEQAVVPTQVEAGLAGAPAGSHGGSSLPLWALSLGAGLFLTGASRLRRTSRIPR